MKVDDLSCLEAKDWCVSTDVVWFQCSQSLLIGKSSQQLESIQMVSFLDFRFTCETQVLLQLSPGSHAGEASVRPLMGQSLTLTAHYTLCSPITQQSWN